MDGSWLWEQLTLYPPWTGLWLALSFLLAALTGGATRLLAPDSAPIVRVIRWVLWPYIGLILGVLSPRLMGVSDIPWDSGLRVGVVLLAGIVALLVTVRIGLHTDRKRLPVTPLSGGSLGFLLSVSGAQEFHWCFLRGAVWEFLLSSPTANQIPLYWAVWISAALSLPGIFVHSRHSAERLIAAVILLTTTTLFLYTRNFWLCWLLHLSISVILQSGLPRRQPAA